MMKKCWKNKTLKEMDQEEMRKRELSQEKKESISYSA
jgi:hypothetical protein